MRTLVWSCAVAASIMTSSLVFGAAVTDSRIECRDNAGNTIFVGNVRVQKITPPSPTQKNATFQVDGSELNIDVLSNGVSGNCKENSYGVNVTHPVTLFCASGRIDWYKGNWELGTTNGCSANSP